MDTSGFYKNDGGVALYGPNFVLGPYDSFELRRENHETYTYPVEGWYWFDSLEEAYSFFNIPLPEENIENNG